MVVSAKQVKMLMVMIVMEVGCARWSFMGLPCGLLPAPPTTICAD
jgi:hypothetical protein